MNTFVETIKEESDGAYNKDVSLEYLENTPMFLGLPPSITDTIHRKYPQIRKIFKKLKKLDWSDDEFRFEKCNADFNTAYNGSNKVLKDCADLMIDTILWQWEADSVASNAPISIIALMNPCAEVWEAESEISKNEIIHANSYSEMVRLSFNKPQNVLEKLIESKDQLQRLEIVEKTLGYVKKEFLKYQLGLSTLTKDELTKLVILTYFTAFCLERIQFMASFAITFSICDITKSYQPIGECVQKICQDELETHVEIRREILKELQKQHPDLFEECKDEMREIFIAIVESELSWTNVLFTNRSIPGLTTEVIQKWVLYNASDVAYQCNLDTDMEFPKENPMPSMKQWMNINLTQNAMQEGDATAYMVNIVSTKDMKPVGQNTFDI